MDYLKDYDIHGEDPEYKFLKQKFASYVTPINKLKPLPTPEGLLSQVRN
jgi:hypothetical protein